MAPGTRCGAATDTTLVTVEYGPVSCVEAREIVTGYKARAHSEGGGNTWTLTVGEWVCSSPTLARANELNAANVCEKRDGSARLTTPLLPEHRF